MNARSEFNGSRLAGYDGAATDDALAGMILPDIQRKAMEAVCDELQRLGTLIEDNTTGVSQQFQAIAADTTRQTDTIETLIASSETFPINGEHLSLTDVASGLQSSLAGLVSKISFLSSRGQTMIHAFEEVLSEVQAVHDSVSQINKINSRTNLLALNAKIEAAHAGAAGRGFSIVANEVRELAMHTNTVSTELRSRINRVQTVLGESFDLLKEIATIDLADENIFTNERVQMIVQGLINQHSQFTDALGDASATTERVTDEINSAVVRMQFQDRATQSIENLRSILGVVANSIIPAADTGLNGAEMLEKLERAILLGDMKQRVHARITGIANAKASTAESSANDRDIELF